MKFSIQYLKLCSLLVVSAASANAQANNVSFDQALYSGSVGIQINVTVSYDFTSFIMFGGGFDLIYDPEALEFVSYTQAPLAPDAEAPASPIGYLESPGNYIGAGVGTFEGFFRITSANDFGTFVFVLLGDSSILTTPCGMTLCLTPTAFNPMTDLAGNIVDQEIFSNGISAATVQAVPLPAAIWLILGALGVVLFSPGKTRH